MAADPYDEQAVRSLMRALVADGRASAALAAYDDLAARLREELGTAPDRETADLHLAVLRETSLPAETPADHARRAPAPGRPRARAGAWRSGPGPGWRRPAGPACCWSRERPASARPGCSTPWPTWPSATGGRVLRGRCHPAERSLFLQPFVDALRPALLEAAPAALAAPGPRPRRRLGLARARARRGGHADRAAAGRRRPPAPPGLRRRGRRPAPAGARPAGAADGRRPPGRRCRDRRPPRLPRRPPRRRPRPGGRRRAGRGRRRRRAARRPRHRRSGSAPCPDRPSTRWRPRRDSRPTASR